MGTTVLMRSGDTVAPLVVEPTLVSVPRVSLIMPVYNEQGKIAECVKNATAHLDTLGIPYEVVVVDDGSTDNTRSEAMSVRSNPRVNVVGYAENHGKGYAIKHGVKYVSGDVVIFMDGDADVKPELTGQYLAVLEKADIAIASKRHPASEVSMPIIRKLLSHSFHCLVMLLTGVRVSDTQSGFKAFRREALSKLVSLMAVKHYAFDVELLTVAQLLKLRVVELPIRIELKGSIGVRHVARMFLDLLGITYRLRVIRWYQNNLHNAEAKYKPVIKW